MNGRQLFISFDYRSINIDTAITVLRNTPGVDIAILSRRQVRHLRWTLWRLGARKYDAVLIDLPFKHIHEQYRALHGLPRLITYEEDACQDRIPHSKWFGRFTAFYQRLPGIRVMVSGYQTLCHFREHGIDAHFAPKGYNDQVLHEEKTCPKRDIHVGFVGRLRASVYRERDELIGQAVARLDCRALRTETPDEYRATLNRILFFFSADRGLGEYMAKNFEAMACGCILVAWRQGGGEEDFLGLEDNENCLLYSSIDEAAEKISALDDQPDRLEKIRENGASLVRQRFSHTRLGQILRDTLTGASD